tara:strand:+ start:2197 stop:2646 length:450 start_codon:yes stop_codon:yes gene_type:complete
MVNYNLNNKEVIVFDGVCALCNNFVIFVIKNDTKNLYKFVSLQNIEQNKLQDFDKLFNEKINSIVLIKKELILSKSDAVIEIFRKLSFPYNLSPILLLIPRAIRNWAYNIIAKKRFKIFGKIEYCSIVYSKKNKSILKEKILNSITDLK